MLSFSLYLGRHKAMHQKPLLVFQVTLWTKNKFFLEPIINICSFYWIVMDQRNTYKKGLGHTKQPYEIYLRITKEKQI